MSKPPAWWSTLYDADGEQLPLGPPTAEDDADPDRPWWRVPRSVLPPLPDEDEAAAPPGTPTIHVTVTPPAAPPAGSTRGESRRAARIRWLLIHGSAAVTGWGFGLVGMFTEAMATAGTSAVPMGVGFCVICLLPAVYLPGLPYLPGQLRPLTMWLARIPLASAVLAVLLYAPGGVR